MTADGGPHLDPQATAVVALPRKLRAMIVRDVCFTRDIADSPVGPVSKQEVARAHLAALHRLGVGILTVDQALEALGHKSQS